MYDVLTNGGTVKLDTKHKRDAANFYQKTILAKEFGWSEKQINETTVEFIQESQKILNLINHKSK